MREKLTQPKVRRYRSWLSQDNRMGSKSYIYDETSRTLLDELFELLKQVAPTQEDGTRTLWFHADRGSIEDYGDADELIEDGEFDSKEEFIQTWEEEYPDEVEWYRISPPTEDGALALDQRTALEHPLCFSESLARV